MQDVAANYPNDHEAQIFYALALAVAADAADKTYTDQLKAGAILEKLFQQEPTHPGLAHYIIHAYDEPALAGRALTAARRQAQTAEELHASDYEAYAYLQTGQDQAAERIVKSLPEIASRFDPKAVLIGAGPPAAGFFALGAIPARYALEREDWLLRCSAHRKPRGESAILPGAIESLCQGRQPWKSRTQDSVASSRVRRRAEY